MQHDPTVISHEKGDYQEVKVGEPVPYDGLLFTYDGMTKVIVKLQTKFKLLEVQKGEELEKIKNEKRDNEYNELIKMKKEKILQ